MRRAIGCAAVGILMLAGARPGAAADPPKPWVAWQAAADRRVASPAPPFALSDLEGRSWSLDGLRGRPVVLHFGTSW